LRVNTSAPSNFEAVRSFLFLLLFSFQVIVFAQGGNRKSASKNLTRTEYIEFYAPFAVQEMLLSGVPASITLAQGILESGDGNSNLARKANNHFGIKCHGLWKGEKHYMHDDAENECFRVYDNVFESYRDHSDFLSGRTRYAALFKLRKTDYKGWAKGLKKAGYATNPKYPALLIKIIEENDLDKYDRMKKPPKGKLKLPKEERLEKEEKPQKPSKQKHREHAKNEQEAIVSIFHRQMYLRNQVRFVRVEKGDTYKGLERLFQVRMWQILKYNDKANGASLVPGEIIYLQPKRGINRAHSYHFVAEGETMRWISQEYAVSLTKLYKNNQLNLGEEPAAGEKIWLRKQKRSDF